MIEFRVVDIFAFLIIIVGGVTHVLVDYVKPRLISSDRVDGVGEAFSHLDPLFTFKTFLTENQES